MRISTRVSAPLADDPAGRFEAVHLGHADVHEDDVGLLARDELDRLDAVGGLADDLDVVGRAQQHREAAAHERLIVGDRDPDRIVTRRPRTGSSATTRKPPPDARPGVERAAVDADAFAHAQQPVAAVGRAAVDAAAVVGDLEAHRARFVADARRSRAPGPRASTRW